MDGEHIRMRVEEVTEEPTASLHAQSSGWGEDGWRAPPDRSAPPCGPFADADAFLHALFDRRVYRIGPTEAPCVGRQASGGGFHARAWDDGGDRARATPSDTHFGISLFENNTPAIWRDGGYRRRNSRWTGTALIALDDVGEVKNGVAIRRPPVPPTAIVETKPGSEQWLFALTEIARDPDLVETILQSAASGGLTDPAAKDRTRVVRLPGSLPPGKTHAARLIYWNPSRRFVPRLLVEKGFQVPEVGRRAARFASGARAGRVGAPVRIAPQGDPMLDWLSARGMTLGQPGPEGWTPIVCPWVGEHTGGDDSGTYYMPPTDAQAYSAFNCFHGHCAHRKSRDFRDECVATGAPFVQVIGDPLIGAPRTFCNEAAAKRIFGG